MTPESVSLFVQAARGKSQEEIIIEFLDAVLQDDDDVEQGSVLLNHQAARKLILFNESSFLFRKHFLDPTAEHRWPRQFEYFEGIAGRAFRSGRTQVFQRASGRDSGEFVGDSPIQNMVCIPFFTNQTTPFGVVCLHNNDEGKTFDEARVRDLERVVDILALALHTPHPEVQVEDNVFIVHGRDEATRNGLENILLRHGARPRVLWREDKNAQLILAELEKLIRVCRAGFVVITPDDEGRLAGRDEELVPRARENVIFEMGLLFARFRAFDRVALLVRRPTVLPSDLGGVAYESFDRIEEIEARILRKLEAWGFEQRPDPR